MQRRPPPLLRKITRRKCQIARFRTRATCAKTEGYSLRSARPMERENERTSSRSVRAYEATRWQISVSLDRLILSCGVQ